jgi:hypothetical protein
MASRFILSGSCCPGSGRAGGGGAASAGVQALPGVEESAPTGSARDRDGAPTPDSAAKPRQSFLGRAEDPWRATEAAPHGIAGDGFEVHAPAAAAAVTGVAHVFEGSRQGSDRVGFFTVPTATFRVLFVLVVLSHDRRRLVHYLCHGTSDRGSDWAAPDRGVRAGGGPTASDP